VDPRASVPGLAPDSLDLTLEAIRDFARARLPEPRRLELDAAGELPAELLREMHGGRLGLLLLSLSPEHGGAGAGAFDLYRVAETLAGVDLAVATSVLATFLGNDLIRSAATSAQRDQWLRRIAGDGLITAFCATEPQAGSDLAALSGRAERVEEGGVTVAYRLHAAKQWISNAGIADLYLVLARAPAGPSWFLVDGDAAGLTCGRSEPKHGVRASRTGSVFLDDVVVAADRLLGASEGAGLAQTGAVLARERLIAAACGLGAGWAALDRALAYSRERTVGGEPLARKRGYTHKLIVPHVVRLETGRAFLEETAARHDAGEVELVADGALAKLLCTEAGNAAADAALQALGANGYSRDFGVEKIRRDVRVTTIYEGTSEVLEDAVTRGRWKAHLRSGGDHYLGAAERLDALHAHRPDAGAAVAALALRSLAAVLEGARTARLTRHGHLWLRLGELMAVAEGAAALARRAAGAEGAVPTKGAPRLPHSALETASRIGARHAALRVATEGRTWLAQGDSARCDAGAEPPGAPPLAAVLGAQAGLLEDLDRLADVLTLGP
jgi:acyl-CoA dehydrogenase